MHKVKFKNVANSQSELGKIKKNQQTNHETKLKTFPSGHWLLRQTQKEFLENCAKTLGIKQPSDWGSVTNKQIINLGGSSLLNIYSGSLKRALKSNFPHITWKSEWLKFQGPRFWHDKSNQKNFLKKVEFSLKISKPSDWGSVTCAKLNELGGAGLLKIYGSTIKALQNVFPGYKYFHFNLKEIHWKRHWFHVTKYPKWYFESKENSRIFLDEIAEKHNLKGVNDWQRITTAVIKKSGGQGLLNKYNNSLWEALRIIYPGNSWDDFFKPSSVFRTRSTTHNILANSLKQIMPNEFISINFQKFERIMNKGQTN